MSRWPVAGPSEYWLLASSPSIAVFVGNLLNDFLVWFKNFNINIIIIIIIIIIITAFLQGIFKYIPETNHTPRVCSVAAVL